MSDNNKLGKLLDNDPGRDAVHIAIVGVVAACNIEPGEHVWIMSNGKATLAQNDCDFDAAIGIVDPFLRGPVKEGQRFYLCLYPNTITSLRHVWTHPAFPEKESPINQSKVDSENWLREYVKRNCPYYKDNEEGYREFLRMVGDGQIYYYGKDLSSYSDLDEPEELFRHLEIVLGHRLDREEITYSCSC